jgi:UDP-N-acetylmuramoyl-tripeptide--D-alanyl-D-alanine ligase
MMGALRLKQIAQQLHGQIRAVLGVDDDPAVLNIATDTRKIQRGDLYVALKGERFDGNEFVADAASKGAVAAVVSEDSDHAENAASTIPQIAVKDTRAALGLIARINRRAFHEPLIAITGSAGKTTTKNMLASILSSNGEVLFTQGNYNNEIGVPLTLLRLEPTHRAAVIEMGAARRGDITYLCQFAEPDIAVLTGALPAHIEGFGNLENVAHAKGEIFQNLSPQGVAIINADSPYFSLWKSMANCKQWTFGLKPSADFSARDIESDSSSSRFLLITPIGEIPVHLPLPGRHSISNALAAAAAAVAAGANLRQVQEGLQRFIGESGRLTRHEREDGLIVIDDSYNANPGSVQAAIDVLVKSSGKKILALGHMAELGADAERMHIEVAAYARSQGVDQLLLVGQFAEIMAARFGEGAEVFSDRVQLAEYAQQHFAAGDTILVKGSRSAGMETVVYALLPHLAQEELH